MAKKELTYRGKTVEELKALSREEFMELVPSRARRSLKRKLTDAQKRFLDKVKKANEGARKKPVKTHCRNMVVLPEMLGLTILIHNGKEFVSVLITHEMLGKYLGEYAMSRKRVAHSAPGIGATKSSSAMSVK